MERAPCIELPRFIFERGSRLDTRDNTAMADREGTVPCPLAEAEVFKGLKIYVITLVALTAIAWTIAGIRGVMLHEPYPRNTLFFNPEVRFSDFLDLSERVPHMGEPHVLPRTHIKTTPPYPAPYPYPAASFYVFIFFVRLFPNPLAAYLTFVLLAFCTATALLSLHVYRMTPKKLPQIAVWATLLLGFPLMFLLDRGNIEAVIWVLVLLGIAAYTRNRFPASAIFWAIAASMKIFPGLLFVLFLAKRKYRTFALAAAATITFAVLALAGIGPTIRQAAVDSSKSTPFLTDGYILVRTASESTTRSWPRRSRLFTYTSFYLRGVSADLTHPKQLRAGPTTNITHSRVCCASIAF